MYLDELLLKIKTKNIRPIDIVELFESHSYEVFNASYFSKLNELLKELKSNNYNDILCIIYNATFNTDLLHLMILKYTYEEKCHNSKYFIKLKNASINVTSYKELNELLMLLNSSERNDFIKTNLNKINLLKGSISDLDLNVLTDIYDSLNNTTKVNIKNGLKQKVALNPDYKMELNTFNKKYYLEFRDYLDNVTYMGISYKDIIAILNDTMRKAASVKIGNNAAVFDFSDKSLNIIYNYLNSSASEYVLDPIKSFLNGAIKESINDDNKKEIIITEDNYPYIDSVIKYGSKTKCLIGYRMAIKNFYDLKKIKNKDKIEVDFFDVKPNMTLQNFLDYYDQKIYNIETKFFTELEKYIYIYSLVKDSNNKLLELNILMNLCNIHSQLLVTYDMKTASYKGYNLSAIRDAKYQINEVFVSDPTKEENCNKDFSTYKHAFYQLDEINEDIDSCINKYNNLTDVSKNQLAARTMDEAFNYVNRVINPEMTEDYSKGVINYVFNKSNLTIPIDGKLTLEKSLCYGIQLFDGLFRKPNNLDFSLQRCELNSKTDEVEFTYAICLNGLANEDLITAINALEITDGICFPCYHRFSDYLEIEFYFDKNVALQDFIRYIEYMIADIVKKLEELDYVETNDKIRTRRKED